MKKRILAILLSALLVMNISACNYEPNDNAQEETTTENSGTKDSSTNDAQNNNNANNENGLIQVSTYTTQNLVDTLQLSNAFSSVLKNEATIWDSTNSSFTYLNNFIIGSMEYAYVSALDLDEVNGNEVIVIESGEDVIILKEHEGMIYAWQYRHTALYNLRVDGTYNWSEQGGNIYGSAKLQFDGASKSSIELDRVEYNEKFYINEIEVTEEEFLTYAQSQDVAKETTQYLWKTGYETHSNAESNQVQNGESNKITLSEYQELVGCYVTTKSSENLKYLMTKDEEKIKVEHDTYDATFFYITTFQDGTECKTSISLSEGIRMPDIYCGFTSEQNGYVIIFNMEGYAVSPMDDIELACVLRTADGGKTWDKTEYSDFGVSNSREYISAACFFTENIGFFTARYTNTDHFGPRTYWTVNGGETWTSMPRLDIPNMLAPFGIGGDFSSEISDISVVDGTYTITVRICHGYSVMIDEETIYDIYIQYSSTDLVNWSPVS